jgi:hypothetical protein
LLSGTLPLGCSHDTATAINDSKKNSDQHGHLVGAKEPYEGGDASAVGGHRG